MANLTPPINTVTACISFRGSGGKEEVQEFRFPAPLLSSVLMCYVSLGICPNCGHIFFNFIFQLQFTLGVILY